jgi:hypothetical protein
LPTYLAAEAIVGAAANVGLCAWLLARRAARGRQPLLAAITGGLALAQAITAVVLLTGNLSVWDTAAWLCIAVALGCLVAAALAGRGRGALTA